MNWCYDLCSDYGLAIILFTFFTKIILLPVSIWVYFDSLKMVKIQPDLNFLKVKYYGQKDMIAEKQAKLFKKMNYHPMASTIPTIIQLILLMGVVGVIRQGIENPLIDMSFGPVDLGATPSKVGLSLIWSPIIAGISSWILCLVMNASNVLQAEQSNLNKYGTMALSVGLSLYLGWFVFVGTAFYWVCSNLMAVLQLYILNAIIRPRRYIDYDRLEESRKALASIQNVGKTKKDSKYYENKRREKADYKKFFSVVNKHLVFYSESNGFYKYFKGFIEHILKKTNLTIHYITSDPSDNIFSLAEKEPRIRPYYIGENRLITLMMKMDADVVVMTMPDLENYHIKRSYVRDDVEYVFVQHGMGSNNLTLRKGYGDHFDTEFLAGPHQKEEVLETEKVYGTGCRNLIEVGYPVIDEMREKYDSAAHVENERKKILIAPSWQSENIIDSCLEEILDGLKGHGYSITVRPHPQEVRLKQDYMVSLKEKYESNKDVEIQTDFSSNNPILEADLLITDWSDISWEYAFTTRNPVLFIDTPMKIMNPEYQKLDTIPINIVLRDKLGRRLGTDELDKVHETVDYLIDHKEDYHKQIEDIANEYLYNLGYSAQVGGDYLINAVIKKVSEKGEKQCRD